MGSAQSLKSTSYWIVLSLFLEYPMTSYIPDSPVPGERMNCFPWRLSGLRNSWSSSAEICLGLMDGLERGNSRLLTMGGVGCEALLYNIEERQYDDQASWTTHSNLWCLFMMANWTHSGCCANLHLTRHMRAAWAPCKILTRLDMWVGKTGEPHKTQLVKVPWHRTTDIITACKVFIGSFLDRLPALTRFSNKWRLLDLHHSCVEFGLVCFEYFSILHKNRFVFQLLLCHVFNEVEDSGRVTHDSGPSWMTLNENVGKLERTLNSSCHVTGCWMLTLNDDLHSYSIIRHSGTECKILSRFYSFKLMITMLALVFVLIKGEDLSYQLGVVPTTFIINSKQLPAHLFVFCQVTIWYEMPGQLYEIHIFCCLAISLFCQGLFHFFPSNISFLFH